jgi:type IV pilus assembly protein PilF
MRALVCAAGVLAAALGGCATQPASQGGESISLARAKVHTELAAQYYERAQLGVAMEELGKALKSEPNYAPAYNVRGLINMALREDRQAEEDFQHSLRLDSGDSDAHNNYGWFLCQRGRTQESIKRFMTALKNPLYATPEKSYLNAGVCSTRGGNNKDAEEFLQKALLLRPNMPEALLELAKLSFDSGDHAGAKSYFLRFDQNREIPMTAEALWLGVRIERRMGDRNSEESYALQLRKRFPESREAQLLQQRQ